MRVVPGLGWVGSNNAVSPRYVYGSEVASLRTSDDEIVSEGKCLSISDATRRKLRDGDKIRYKVNITQLINSDQTNISHIFFS